MTIYCDHKIMIIYCDHGAFLVFVMSRPVALQVWGETAFMGELLAIKRRMLVRWRYVDCFGGHYYHRSHSRTLDEVDG